MCSENLFSPRRFALVLIYLLAFLSAAAQSPQGTAQSEKARGVQLYQQKDYKGAIQMLKKAAKSTRDDPEIWYYLGLSFKKLDKNQDALKALQNAVKLNPQYEPAHSGIAFLSLLRGDEKEAQQSAEKALSLDAQSSDAIYVLSCLDLRNERMQFALERIEYGLQSAPANVALLILKAQTFISMFGKATQHPREGNSSGATLPEDKVRRYAWLKTAADSLEKAVQLNPMLAEQSGWREQLEALRYYGAMTQSRASEITSSVEMPGVLSISDLTTKPVIVRLVHARYTNAAQQAGVSGRVRLLVIIDETGSAQRPLVLQSLSHGLTEQAIKAARNCQFKPGTKEGKPVSAMMQMEFTFNIY